MAIFGSASKPEKKRRLHQDHTGATVFDVFGIAFGNISNKLLAEVHGNRTRSFFAADKHRISSLEKFLLTVH